MKYGEQRGDETGRIRRRLRDLEKRGVNVEYNFQPGGYGPARPPVLYLRDELVTTKEYAHVVHRILESWFGECGRPEPIADDHDAVVIRVDGDSLELARQITGLAGTGDIPAGIAVGPHHVFTPAQRPQIGPGSDPTPASAPGRRGPESKSSIRIGVVDTGIWRQPAGQLAAQTVPGADEEIVDAQPDGVVDHYGTGHGGFIAGVIETNLPGIEVMSENAFGPRGMTEQTVIQQVDECLTKDKVLVLNLSLGTYEAGESCRPANLVALRAAMQKWNRQYPKSLIIAAAGNDATAEPFYPAAYAAEPEFGDFVVSVGALETRSGTGLHSAAAPFSNSGHWVTAWAPGADIVSAYPKGISFNHVDAAGNVTTDVFTDGLAKWSGTSFAAPFVAAEIVREMQPGESPRDTWRRIRGASPFVIFWPGW